MNSKIIIIIVSVLLLLIIGTILLIFKLNYHDTKRYVLNYKISAGIPFKWVYEIEDDSIVKCVETKVVRNDNKRGKVGAPIYTDYVFKGLKKGKTTVTFKYVYIGVEEKVEREDKYTFEVDKDLNINLVKE